jgi:hypothetical protein
MFAGFVGPLPEYEGLLPLFRGNMVFGSAEVSGYDRTIPCGARTEVDWQYPDYSLRSFCCQYIPTGPCAEPVSRAILVHGWHVGDMAGPCATFE